MAPFGIDMEPTRGDYTVANVKGIDTLKDRLAEAAGDVRELSFILADYISWGNNKIADSVAIFNMNSATDCPNADSGADNESDVGACQVPWSDCYAHKAENIYKQVLPYRRRQEYLWDSLSAKEFAGAFKCIVSRKRKDVTDIRFSEAGDFRNGHDIQKVNRIAQMLAPDGINVYTYSASHKLDWSQATHFTVNQSNNLADYGDRLFTALPEGSDLPDGMVWCPYDDSDGEIQCGECRLCINEEGPDVAIELH
jgi:hypothetical protein